MKSMGSVIKALLWQILSTFLFKGNNMNKMEGNVINIIDMNKKKLSKKIDYPFFVKYLTLKMKFGILISIQFCSNALINKFDQINYNLLIFLMTFCLNVIFSNNSLKRIAFTIFFFSTSLYNNEEYLTLKLILDFLFNIVINSSIQVQIGTITLILFGKANSIFNSNEFSFLHIKKSVSEQFIIYFFLNIFYILVYLQRKYIKQQIEKQSRKYESIIETYQDKSHFLVIIDEKSKIISANSLSLNFLMPDLDLKIFDCDKLQVPRKKVDQDTMNTLIPRLTLRNFI